MVGLIRDQSSEIYKVLNLPDYTYPIFGIALGKVARLNKVKPRLPLEATAFKAVSYTHLMLPTKRIV